MRLIDRERGESHLRREKHRRERFAIAFEHAFSGERLVLPRALHRLDQRALHASKQRLGDGNLVRRFTHNLRREASAEHQQRTQAQHPPKHPYLRFRAAAHTNTETAANANAVNRWLQSRKACPALPNTAIIGITAVNTVPAASRSQRVQSAVW